jgi:VanZ family protein
VNVRRWVPPIAWAAIILILTSITGADLPRLPFADADKVAHGALYGVLGLLSLRASWRPGRVGWSLVVVLASVALMSALDEWHQQFISGRSVELLDWLADCLGATVGAVAASAMARREERA